MTFPNNSVILKTVLVKEDIIDYTIGVFSEIENELDELTRHGSNWSLDEGISLYIKTPP